MSLFETKWQMVADDLNVIREFLKSEDRDYYEDLKKQADRKFARQGFLRKLLGLTRTRDQILEKLEEADVDAFEMSGSHHCYRSVWSRLNELLGVQSYAGCLVGGLTGGKIMLSADHIEFLKTWSHVARIALERKSRLKELAKDIIALNTPDKENQ